MESIGPVQKRDGFPYRWNELFPEYTEISFFMAPDGVNATEALSEIVQRSAKASFGVDGNLWGWASWFIGSNKPLYYLLHSFLCIQNTLTGLKALNKSVLATLTGCATVWRKLALALRE